MAPFETYTGDTSLLTSKLLAANTNITVVPNSIVLKVSDMSAISIYDGSLTPLGIGAGLLLTSGYAPGTVNTVWWDGQDNSGSTGFYNGDADIDAVVNTVFQTQSYDATTLEFDFTVSDPAATSISFDLVFGSEEYPEWVDAFVDSAIVMVNGVNYALFNHDPNHPLSVITPNLTAGYFQDNASGFLPIEYDGVSHLLKIVAPINSGATNHIKIGIADTGDHILDSGVFIANLTAGTTPGSGVVITPPTITTDASDTVAGSAKDELIDLKGGDDLAYAGGGDDIVMAGAGNDTVYGGSGEDVLEGDAGDDVLDGGEGTSNTAVYTGTHMQYAYSYDSNSDSYTITDNQGIEGSDTLKNIQLVKFSDGLFDLTSTGLVSHSSISGVISNTPGSVIISGIATAGNTLTAIIVDADGLSTNTPSYEWQVSTDNGASWSSTGVTTDRYTLSTGDAGKQFRVTADYTDAKSNQEMPMSAVVTVAQTKSGIVIKPMTITAPTGASIMDPLTTLIKNAVDLGYTPNEASLAIKNAFGIAGNINLATYDAYAILSQNPTDTVAIAFLKTAVQVAMAASVSDPTGLNMTLAALKATAVLNLTDSTVLASAGVDSASMSLVTALNKDIADAGTFTKIQQVWNDWAGQKDNLKPFLNHLEKISVHINQAPSGSATFELPVGEQGVSYIIDASNLLVGFSDPEGGNLSVTNLVADVAGEIIDNNDGTWSFVPYDVNYAGPVELSYEVSDAQGASIPASQLFVLVTAAQTPMVNNAPVGSATAPLAAGNEDSAYTIAAADLLQGFSDVDGDALSITSLTVNHGALVNNGNGSWTFTPVVDYNGQVDLTYSVNDGNGGSIAAIQAFSLIPVNDAPIGNVVIKGTPTQGQQLLADTTSLSDPDGVGIISYQWLANGSVISGATGTNYTLSSGDVGKKISVAASYTDSFNTQEKVTSLETVAVAGVVTNLTLTGTKNADKLNGAGGNDSLTGLAGDDSLNGGASNDTLSGGTGNDILTGGTGNDYFVFDSTLSASSNKDTIADFNHVDDTIQLSKSIFSKFTTQGAINAGNFVVGSKALDSNDYLIYNAGTIYYDADGNGSKSSAIAVVTLTGTPSIDSSDFVIIA